MSDGKKTYEVMFVLDGSGAEFEAVSEPVRRILERNEVEVLSMKPWDDRRLAYEIKGRRRGLYVLAYLSVDPGKVVEIEHDCQLSEEVLRVLFLAREHLTEDELRADTPMTAAARRTSEAPRPKPPEPVPAASEDKPSESGPVVAGGEPTEAERKKDEEAEQAPEADAASVDSGAAEKKPEEAEQQGT